MEKSWLVITPTGAVELYGKPGLLPFVFQVAVDFRQDIFDNIRAEVDFLDWLIAGNGLPVAAFNFFLEASQDALVAERPVRVLIVSDNWFHSRGPLN